MDRYRVTLLGRNVLICRDGRTDRYGFTAERLIEAEDASSASEKAMHLVRTDEGIVNSMLNSIEDPPLIFVEHVTIDSSDHREDAGTGYVFFREEAAAAGPCLDLDQTIL